MANNEKTSKTVASKASKILSNPRSWARPGNAVHPYFCIKLSMS